MHLHLHSVREPDRGNRHDMWQTSACSCARAREEMSVRLPRNASEVNSAKYAVGGRRMTRSGTQAQPPPGASCSVTATRRPLPRCRPSPPLAQ